MEYNSQREDIRIKEYGRNIQKLIEYAKTVKDKEERNNTAKAILKLMSQINPQSGTPDEYNQKIWSHLYMISSFDIDIDAPVPMPDKEVAKAKVAHRLHYPEDGPRLRHYGRNVQLMIDSAVEMEDKEKQKAFAEVIGNYMKMVYRNWNRENVSDDVIIDDMKRLSGGKLTIEEDSNLDNLSHSTRKRTPKPSNYRGKGKSSGRRKPSR